MATKLDLLEASLRAALGEHFESLAVARGEITIVGLAKNALHLAATLKTHPDLQFEQLMDLCGLDYSAWGQEGRVGPRFAVVSHLLSISQNWRVRLTILAEDDAFPIVPSFVEIWPSANWYEREAFDLFGIIFENHPDLRRILTDYGFIGHPFRKDFPVSGHVEMRYDPEQKRVIYQPVTIEPREIVPRIIREEGYGGLH
jgi:NADH-quinone oxidoreductase subunit C